MVIQCSLGGTLMVIVFSRWNVDGHTVFSRGTSMVIQCSLGGNVDGHIVFSRGNVDGHTVFSRGRTLMVIQCSLGER